SQLADRVTKRRKSPRRGHRSGSRGGRRPSEETVTATDQLREILDRRIGVLEACGGVLTHRGGLSEAESRGEPLREHGRDVKGDPDLLNLTRPELIAEIHD